jgi:hypothetical protein
MRKTEPSLQPVASSREEAVTIVGEQMLAGSTMDCDNEELLMAIKPRFEQET